ncbi:MAG: phosphoesterase [Gammaproteobacteria bacterium]|nr:phosphoesterase [Gammaproteobacteria bacterium]
MRFRNVDSILKFTAKTFFPLLVVYTVFFAFLDIPFARLANDIFPDTIAWYIANIISMIFDPGHWLILGILALIIGAMQTYWRRNHVSHVILLFALSIIISYGFHFFSLDDVEHSTPSGHTTLTVAGLYSLYLMIPKAWLRYVFIGITVMVALARIVSLEHFPSDVLLGVYVGMLSVYWAEFLLPKLYARLIKEPKEAYTKP